MYQGIRIRKLNSITIKYVIIICKNKHLDVKINYGFLTIERFIWTYDYILYLYDLYTIIICFRSNHLFIWIEMTISSIRKKYCERVHFMNFYFLLICITFAFHALRTFRITGWVYQQFHFQLTLSLCLNAYIKSWCFPNYRGSNKLSVAIPLYK